MAQGRETRSFLIFIKEVLQAGCFDGQYIWFFPVTQLPVECLQHTIRGGSLSLSLSFWSAVLNGMSHFSTLFCFLAWVCPGHAEKIFFQTTYICVLYSFNVSTRMNSKLWKTGFVVNCTNFKGKHRKKIAVANKNSWDTTTYNSVHIWRWFWL